MAAVAADPKLAHSSAHQPNPEYMRQLVTEDVDDEWSRQSEERDQPKDHAEGKKPKFRASPELLVNSCAGEGSEKCLRQDRAPRQQKECDNIFHPARRHRQWHRMIGRAPPRPPDVAHDFNTRRFATTLTGRPARRHEIILSCRANSRHL